MSTIKVNSIEPANAGSEDYFLARAWVNFNGTGTVAINQSANVSSLTDHAVGQYSVNLTNAMAYSTYGFSCNTIGNSTSFSRTGGAGMSGNRSSTSSAFSVDTGCDGSSTYPGVFFDRSVVSATVWGDLA